MANYTCTTRTNYFHVKDAEKFKNLMAEVSADEDISAEKHTLWEEKDDAGEPVFGFGLYGSIYGMPSGEDADYDLFIHRLQECIADKDAVIIFSAGHEKLRYVEGSALVITGDGTRFLSLTELAVEKAGEMLGEQNWTTRCDY